jgi:hypothetical protein
MRSAGFFQCDHDQPFEEQPAESRCVVPRHRQWRHAGRLCHTPKNESGHPVSSKVSLYEQFLRRLIEKEQSNRLLWETAAILVTVDERGGYSGYIQFLDTFGIPLIAISPFAKNGAVDHTYTERV